MFVFAGERACRLLDVELRTKPYKRFINDDEKYRIIIPC